MKELKGSQTEANLLAAFAGESQARNKYTYYASKAKKDGYEQIAGLFLETAENEKEHAKIWFKLLHDGMPDTMENLKDAAAGENYDDIPRHDRRRTDKRTRDGKTTRTLPHEIRFRRLPLPERHDKLYGIQAIICKYGTVPFTPPPLPHPGGRTGNRSISVVLSFPSLCEIQGWEYLV